MTTMALVNIRNPFYNGNLCITCWWVGPIGFPNKISKHVSLQNQHCWAKILGWTREPEYQLPPLGPWFGVPGGDVLSLPIVRIWKWGPSKSTTPFGWHVLSWSHTHIHIDNSPWVSVFWDMPSFRQDMPMANGYKQRLALDGKGFPRGRHPYKKIWTASAITLMLGRSP